ncbi:MAG: type I-G CRISPR-associated RAMP protein Csb1/Cas7g [Thermoplasmata archaeon]
MTAVEMDWEKMKSIVEGNTSAIRKIVKLYPAGGPGSKVSPPTYEGGIYAEEERLLQDNVKVNTVFLDTVQSQANRMEMALLEAYKNGQIRIPMLQVDFSENFPEIGVITSLEAPHRISDAIFRDSKLNDTSFRDTDIGKEFIKSNPKNITPLLKIAPHSLIFGYWDSAKLHDTFNNKLQRAITSEIIGINAVKGIHTTSRIDPLPISSRSKIYLSKDGKMTLDPDQAEVNDSGKPTPMKPSELGLGNIAPGIEKGNKNGEEIRGGVTIDYAQQTMVISLPAIRRLHFPLSGEEDSNVNLVARSLLASLALYAFVKMEETGYDLRSGCLLIPAGESHFEIIANDGSVETFTLDAKGAQELMDNAIEEAKRIGLPWKEEVITLKPSEELIKLIKEGRKYKPKPNGSGKNKEKKEVKDKAEENNEEENKEEDENAD